MPELPEVETIRRQLASRVSGRVLTSVTVTDPLLVEPVTPAAFRRGLRGRRVQEVRRRGKYLLLDLDEGTPLALHLRMTGQIHWFPGRPDRAIGHVRARFGLDDGGTLLFADARRFGFMLLVGEDELETHKLFRDLGPEPLGNGLDAAYLAAVAAGRRVDLKAFLMDQRTVAGLGNIYVSEALFRAGLKPSRQASTLGGRGARTSPRAEALVVAIRAVISEAIEAGGSTLRDYRHADGALGYFQHAFAVYGRAGEPCTRPGCRGIVRRTISAGRSTFHCRVCQR